MSSRFDAGTAVERGKRVLSALAMLGVVPALVVIPTHLAAERVRAAWPALDRAVVEMVEALRRGVACAQETSAGERVPQEKFHEVTSRLNSAWHAVAMAAQEATESSPGEVSSPYVPGASGLPEAQATAVALAQDLNALARQQVCGAGGRDRESLAEEQARTDQLLSELDPRLVTYAKRLDAERASLEAGRPLLTALAWLLGVIEVVGWAVTLWLLPRDVRRLLGRRAARAAPG